MAAKDTSLDILGGCMVSAVDETVDLTDNRKFKKLNLSQGRKTQMNALMSQIPALAGMNATTHTMVLKFPDGIHGVLMKLKDMDAYTTTIVDPVTHKIVSTARLEFVDSVSPQAVALGVFSAMSVVSGQYFLSEINDKMTQIKLGIDRLLEFLYGDKQAELLSEVNFVRFAYENYISMMEHSEQRTATIISLQNAKKVAVKDIEFYLSDLSSIVKDRRNSDISTTVSKMVRAKECIDLSLQLFTMSNLMEIYYAQNFDENYISFMKKEASEYISRCEKKLLNNFGQLQQILNPTKESMFTKDNLFNKVDKAPLVKKVDEIVLELEKPGSSEMQKTLQTAVNEITKERLYYISDGEAYLKIA